MDPLLCFPTDLPPEVTLALQNAGLGHQTVSGPDEVGDAVVDGRVGGVVRCGGGGRSGHGGGRGLLPGRAAA